MFVLGSSIKFPPTELADEDGLLALGGDLSTERLLLAYKSGIFPWYNEGEIIQWFSPDPRFVLFPDQLKISKSMQQLLNRNAFDFSFDKDFEAVIHNCRDAVRKEQPGTWIHDDIVRAYSNLHELGFAHSGEAWLDGKLVGGLYGVQLGNIFFGESMFSLVSNASKYAFIKLVLQLQQQGLILVDCQVYSAHLESLGAVMIPRARFDELLYNC